MAGDVAVRVSELLVTLRKACLMARVLEKEQELSYHISQVLDVHSPQLQHGHDGLIFTCAESSYVPGTDEKMYVPSKPD